MECLAYIWVSAGRGLTAQMIMTGILDVETRSESLRFSRIGNLYFKDINADLQAVLLVSSMPHWQLSEKYCIGLLSNYQSEWWRGERTHMAPDCGPRIHHNT